MSKKILEDEGSSCLSPRHKTKSLVGQMSGGKGANVCRRREDEKKVIPAAKLSKELVGDKHNYVIKDAVHRCRT